MFDAIFELGQRPDLIPTNMSSGSTSTVGIKTGDELTRVPRIKLEQSYAIDPVVFNIINKYVYGILQNEYEISTDNPADQDRIDAFEKRIRLRDIVLPKMTQNMCIYGHSWNEIICGEETGAILRLDARDPKYMDIAKGGFPGSTYPLVDKFGEPEYYVQYISHNRKPADASRLIEVFGQKAIRYETEEVLHTNLFTLGDTNEGIGLIEPMFKSINDKWELEHSTKGAIKRIGNPIIFASVGNERVFPTKQIIDQVTERFKNITSRTGFAIPNYVEPKLLETKKPNKLTENLDYYNNQIIAGGGLPESLSTGQGQGANEHTLDSLMNSLKGAFMMIQMNISEAFESQVFPILAESEGLSDIPTFKWKELTVPVFTSESDAKQGKDKKPVESKPDEEDEDSE